MGMWSAASQAVVSTCAAVTVGAQALEATANAALYGAKTLEAHAKGFHDDEVAKIAARTAERKKALKLAA